MGLLLRFQRLAAEGMGYSKPVKTVDAGDCARGSELASFDRAIL